ncbi:MAG TPA: hypothetical protein VLJ76_03965 [Gaiellaceae bacterium]|nr:hypothetical protein [Gaiellaceae bacterium]
MRRLLLLFGLIGLGVAAGTAAASPAPVQRAERFELSGLATGPAAFHDTVIAGSRKLAAVRRTGEWGGSITASDGEVLQIFVSDSYPVDPTVPQSIAEFMIQLYHGPEISQAIVYVAPLDEVQSICGPDAGGCYDPDTENIVVPGDPLPDGTTKETILVHELGHNLARNRLNPPWVAVDWGTKRWATAMNICARTAAGTAFPGDEGANYQLNPGEALAESYRILNFQKQTWPNWTTLTPFILDQSLYPTPAALTALQQDVLQPWTGPTVTSFSGRVVSATRVSKRVVGTPLDGSFSVKLTGKVPAGATISLAVGGKVVAKGLRRASTVVCGARSLSILVRATKPGAFSATYATP